MKLLGSERTVTQAYQMHRYAEDYAGLHLSDIKIHGKGKVVHVVNKYKVYEDTIDYNEYLKNKNTWKDGIYYNCISISGKTVRYHQSELGGNQVKIECCVNSKKHYFLIAHMADVFVKVGDIVDSDTVIGTQGNTGLVLSNKDRTNITYGSHIHFEVMDDKYNKINPREYALFNIMTDYKEQTNEIDNLKKQLKVIVNEINIRQSSTVDSEILGSVHTDEIYTIIEEVDDDKYVWYKIITGLDVTGYVANEKGKNWLEIYGENENVEGAHHQESEEKTMKLIFECPKSAMYGIKLKKGEKLYIE